MLNGKISVVMPAFNESEHIVKNIQEVVDTLSTFNYDFEVILVDDGSPDNTYIHAARVLSKHPELVRVVRYDKNQGKGNALMCGAGYALGEYIVFIDADMDLHPEQLPLFFEIMAASGADAVIGSKRHPLSNVEYPMLRRLYSVFYYTLIRMLFGLPLRDTQTGLKLFKSELLKAVIPRLLAKRFAFDIELLAVAHRLGFKITDSPVTLRFGRPYNRIRISDIVDIFTDTLAIFYRMKLARYYDRCMPEAIVSMPCFRNSFELTSMHGLSLELERTAS